eukprot:CAMPEP_0172540316 /NCGR_PEP_ID=MMETSP1067-20121228/11373_1 /TAXON_ID=265564 ORGANISM="Thalassiosira punctigera, Strain Tpunct2005C2" /NCGR_SAMPLE_ID=MMETSP1067 /ASSEMBLY_ACC=CAM_ASM_000444 /LENGTH=146 /DNA_ID=CAMNT_0013326171 /DNA_START=345 /DNA_END=782 /DNA_ORIENTATION=-
MDNRNDGVGIPDLPDDPTFENMNRAALLAWQERQRRQRTLRMLMMFLMVLLLMDGEEPNPRHQRRHPHDGRRSHLRGRGDGRSSSRHGHWEKLGYLDDDGNLISPLEPEVYRSRAEEDELIRRAVRRDVDSRYHELVEMNDMRDVE